MQNTVEAGKDKQKMDMTMDENVQYLLRNGITHPAPSAKADVPTNEVVAEETLANDLSDSGQDAALWQRLPHHIQLLVKMADAQQAEEVAQKYYTRGFKESRRELIERLLDPTLSLEDTARVLGVVPATVRRYTNRGILPHHRTVGQQRRFRLSDVLSFLEAQQGRRADDLVAA